MEYDIKQAAKDMILLSELHDRMEEIKTRVSTFVLDQEKPLQVGNVKATYYKPSRKYDYETGNVSGGIIYDEKDKIS